MGHLRLQRSWRLVSSVVLVAGLLFSGFLLFDQIYPVDLQPRSAAQVVIDCRGEPLRAFADEQGEWRYMVRLDQVSPLYIKTLIAYEDRWFYRHFGVNPLSLLRAALQWIRNGYIVSGGSTLTMQVARIRYGQAPGIAGKILQMLQALQLEWHYSKDEILEYYVNHAPFGGTLQGVEAASRSYFGYPSAQLTQAQAALLAVLPQSPSRYRPDRYPEQAQKQRNKVLDRLVQYQILTAEQASDAKLENVDANPPRFETLAPLLSRRLMRRYPAAQIIPSFIERDLQRRIEALAFDQKQILPPHTSLAILVMEHGSGKVVAYVGSIDMTDSERFGYIDMVTAERSPGSTLKPFIYGLALDEGLIHSQSLLMDVPLTFGDYRPQNFTRGFSGAVSVSRALQKSLNIPAVQVLEQLGPGNFFARMQTAGAGLLLPPDATPNLTLALGGEATNLQHLVALYSALANEGYVITPRFTALDSIQRRKLLSPGAAWIIRDILAQAKVGESWRQNVAIKTGTSYGNRDAWAIGASEHHTIGVWVGSPDNAAMTGHYGSFTAVPILRSVSAILPDTAYSAHAQPDSVTRKQICWPGGQNTPGLCDQKMDAWILDGVIPPTLMGSLAQSPLISTPYQTFSIAADSGLRAALGCHVQSRQQTLPIWPAALQSWIPAKWRNANRIPPLDPRCRQSDGLLSETPVQIIGLDRNTRLKRHPSTTSQPQLSFKAVGGQPQWYWFLNGELLDEHGDTLHLSMPLPGSYQLAVSDQAGMSDALDFIVEPQDIFR